jgi:hypothetical protein
VHGHAVQALDGEPGQDGGLWVLGFLLDVGQDGSQHLADGLQEVRVLGGGGEHAVGDLAHLALAHAQASHHAQPRLEIGSRLLGRPVCLFFGLNFVDHALDHRLEKRILRFEIVKESSLT